MSSGYQSGDKVSTADARLAKESGTDSVKTLQLGKIYKTGTLEYKALEEVTLSVKRGSFVAIVGPSGSGKTTLLNLIGTLDKPTSGEILIDETPLSQMRGNQLAEFRNEKLGFVFQSYNLIPGLTAEENVSMPLIISSKSASEREKIALEVLREVGLSDKAKKHPNELSGGEQQRVAIARALINNPALILADEPTGNLDTKSSEVIMTLLQNAVRERGVTVVMVTHNMELTCYCDKIIHMRDGRVEREVATAA